MKKSLKRFLIISQVLGWSGLLASACTDEQVKNVSQTISSTNKENGNNSDSTQDADTNSKSTEYVDQTTTDIKMGEKSKDSPPPMSADSQNSQTSKSQIKTQESERSPHDSNANGGATHSGEKVNEGKGAVGGDNYAAGAPNSDSQPNIIHNTGDRSDHGVNTGGKVGTNETTTVSKGKTTKNEDSQEAAAGTGAHGMDPAKPNHGTGSLPEEPKRSEGAGENGKPSAPKTTHQNRQNSEVVAKQSPSK